jgi:glycosyltransferase involved in cell wall biosynthesis
VARYIPEKGLPILWEAFVEAQAEHGGDWQLCCAGHGIEFNQRMQHPRIKHMGFVQPDEMGDLVRDCSVFVLSSLMEPWGMVVHEFAAAGMPLLISDKVGSGECYLKNGENGCMFESGSVGDLKSKLLYIMNLEPGKLYEMGELSNKLAVKYDAKKWSKTLGQIRERSEQQKA